VRHIYKTEQASSVRDYAKKLKKKKQKSQWSQWDYLPLITVDCF